MKQNLKPGDVISFPSLEEMYPQYVKTECRESVDRLCLTNIYKINVVKNSTPASMKVQYNILSIRK